MDPLPQSVPHELSELIRDACALSPHERVPTVLAFRDRLEDFLLHRNARRLAEVAHQTLRQLRALLDRDEPDDAQVQRAFHEARFGFEQSLLEWPGNEAAKRGREAALEVMIRYEIERGNRAATRSLLAAHPSPPQELVEAATALESNVKDVRERLRKLEEDRSLHAPTMVPAFASLSLGFFWLFFLGYLGVRLRSGSFVPTQELNLIVGIGVLLGYGVLAVSLRRSWQNEVRTSVVKASLIFPILFVMARVVSMVRGWPVHTTFMIDFIGVIVFVGTMAIFIHRSFWAYLPIALLCTLAAALFPAWVFEMGGVVVGCGNFLLAWLLRPAPAE